MTTFAPQKAKERALPLKGEEVRAILSGVLTQIQRPLAVQPTFDFPVRYDGVDDEDALLHYWERLEADGETPTEDYRELGKCPYGGEGDLLRVQESLIPVHEIAWGKESNAGGVRAYYKADRTPVPGHYRICKKQPARQLRKEHSRLTLRITDVRVERVNNSWEWVIDFQKVQPR